MSDERRLRALRPPKPVLDPWRPAGVLLEEERLPGGAVTPSFTIFLTGAECPFTCVYCDLWRHTLDTPTPPGAIPAQIAKALAEAPPQLAERTQIKLYNASNFFDARAVPEADDDEILRLLEPFEEVVVECHPKLVGRRAFDFADKLRGRLQIAMGLETVHPEALRRLNKRMTRDDFDRAAAALRKREIGLRAFVLIGAPFVPAREGPRWIERSVNHAFKRGAEHVSLVPMRTGNGETERLANLGLLHPPDLAEIEKAVRHCRELQPQSGALSVDLWDLERFAECRDCFQQRRARLLRFNLSGRLDGDVACTACQPVRKGSC